MGKNIRSTPHATDSARRANGSSAKDDPGCGSTATDTPAATSRRASSASSTSHATPSQNGKPESRARRDWCTVAGAGNPATGDGGHCDAGAGPSATGGTAGGARRSGSAGGSARSESAGGTPNASAAARNARFASAALA